MLNVEALGALLGVLQPHLLVPEGKRKEYAHKLGLGKPLGIGSVRIKVDNIKIRSEKETVYFTDSKSIESIDNAFKEFKERLIVSKEWLELHKHKFTEQRKLNYPVYETKAKDGKSESTIYAWHTNIRREYSKLRREKI
jgi:hypothetical protein